MKKRRQPPLELSWERHLDSSNRHVRPVCGAADEAWLEWDAEVREAGRAAIAESIAAARRTMRAVLAAGLAAMKERLQARADLAGNAVFLAVILFIFHRLWTVVAGESGLAGGFTVAQLTTYLFVTELVTMSPGQVHAGISADVRSGAFTVALLRPLSYAQWEMARAVGGAVARLLALAGSGLCVLALLGAWPDCDPRGLVLGLLALVPAAIVLELCARVVIGLASFWMEDSNPVYWIWQKLAFVLGGLFLPLELYPGWLRGIAEWLPFRVLLHAPARTVVAFDPATALGDCVSLVAWSGVFIGVLMGVEAYGRRHVQTNGG